MFVTLLSVGLSLKQGLMDLVSIFVSVHACICNHISDMYGPILFVLGRRTTPDGVHMHIILFHDAIKDGRLVAILVVKTPSVEHILKHFSDMHLPMLFNLGTQIMNYGLHMHVILLLFLIRSKMADWQPFCYLNVSPTIS